MAYTCCCVYSVRLVMMDRETVRNMLEVYSENKFEKLMHLVGFIIRIVLWDISVIILIGKPELFGESHSQCVFSMELLYLYSFDNILITNLMH